MNDRPDPPIRQKPPIIGRAAADNPVAARPAPARRERLVPKPLQRVLGFVILFAAVGLLSCQAMFD